MIIGWNLAIATALPDIWLQLCIVGASLWLGFGVVWLLDQFGE